MLGASLPAEACPLSGQSDLHSWCSAALMGNKGKVIAVDRDPVRFQRLKDNAKLTGATCIRCIQVRTHPPKASTLWLLNRLHLVIEMGFLKS